MKEIVALRVDRHGEAVAANEEGHKWMARAGTNLCHRIVGAKSVAGHAVCSPTCAGALASGLGQGHCDSRVVIRGRLARLNCHKLGDETVVVVEETRHLPPTPNEILTARELEVLSAVAEGLSTSEVAKRLGVRSSTIRTHVEHLCRRLNVRTRAQAVARAHATGQLT